MPRYLSVLLALLATACSLGRAPASYPTASPAEISTAEAMFGFRFNPDYLRRDQLLGFNEEWGKTDVGGIGYFEQLEAGKLEVLIEEQSVAPDIGHNEAPTPLEFLGFVQDHPQARGGGYAVSPLRADYAVLLTSVHIDDAYMTPALAVAIRQLCRFADEQSTNPLGYCWCD